MIFAPVYLGLGILFDELVLGVVVFLLLAVCVILARRGTEWPLAIVIRAVHIIFVGFVVFMKLSPN